MVHAKENKEVGCLVEDLGASVPRMRVKNTANKGPEKEKKQSKSPISCLLSGKELFGMDMMQKVLLNYLKYLKSKEIITNSSNLALNICSNKVIAQKYTMKL